MNLKELYQEIILEHGKNPRNLRKTEGFNKDAKGNNPLCGDNVHVYLKLNGQKIVEDASFEGSGCAISMASASIMTDLIKGKNEHEAKEIVEDFLGMIKENPELKSEYLSEDEKTKLMCLSGVKQYPMRVKCILVCQQLKKMSELKDKVILEIKKIYDPEIPVNIYELGLIYKIEINDEKKVILEMTLTSPNCPVAESLPKMVKDNILKIDGFKMLILKLVVDPPWTKDKMSEAAKLELNL